VVTVAEREIVEDRNSERLEVMLEHVFHRAASQPRLRLKMLLALVHLTDDDACDPIELPRIP